jgi:hypothetical protein
MVSEIQIFIIGTIFGSGLTILYFAFDQGLKTIIKISKKPILK